ncbi:acyl-CoA thioesterase [Azotosporobacter soli]|uniref:acyl-CoA thioesterase n=1 Tax=Azotosporobacter soli TaxID=3055040 RepID=UPI0031FEF179
MMNRKPIRHSLVTMSAVMMPEHANPAGNVHGGEIMKLMDTAAGVVARRHTRANVVTARVDQLEFHHPVRIGDLVTCHGRLTFTGRSSMEISVSVSVEDLSNEEPEKIALTAFFTLVSLDANGKPQPVPEAATEDEEEKHLFLEGQKRYLSRKKSGA